MAKFIEQNFKSILNKYKFIDSWFWCRYSINPYNGCQFGCVYCDSRSQKYHLPTDFENKIVVKMDGEDLLDKRIANARTLVPDVVVLSGTTDPYQPAEKKYRNTRKCLEVLLKHKYPVHIITKSSMVLDDLDILEEIGKESWCTVSLTITSPHSEIARFLEKLAPPPDERFEVVNIIKQKTRNIQSGVLLIPTIPFLTDSYDDLSEMAKRSRAGNADYMLFSGGLTLRDMQGKWFLKHLVENYPQLLNKYEALFKFKYDKNFYNGNYEPDKNYFRRINNKLFSLCKEHKLNYRIKRFFPNDFRKGNYQIAEKFFNASYKNQITGRSWKKSFWVGHDIQNLKESVLDVAQRKELDNLKNVDQQVESYILKFI